MKWQYDLEATQLNPKTSVRNYLSQHLLLPKHLIYQLRTQHRVTVNSKYLPMNFPLHEHDQIQLIFQPEDFKHPFPKIIPDASQHLNLAYKNQDLVVVNKPKGYKTHPNQPHESGTVLNFMAYEMQPQHQRPYIIHRLDMETSGALIIAKNPAVVPILVRLIADKSIQRNYLAWVKGSHMRPTGQINTPIGLDLNDQRKRKINGLKAKSASTNYQVMQIKNGNTLLKVNLATGRTHQIRVHLASIGHPVIGDPLYNEDSYEAPHPNMQLHSWQVNLILPFTMQHVLVTCPPPASFKPK